MTPMQQAQAISDIFSRGLASQSSAGFNGPTRPAPALTTDPIDRFGEALNAATLAVANISRALRHERLAMQLSELSGEVLINCQIAAVSAALSLDPVAVKESTDETGDELFTMLTAVLDGEHDDAAIMQDPARRREVCRAWVRSLLMTYRQALAGQLAVLRTTASEATR